MSKCDITISKVLSGNNIFLGTNANNEIIAIKSIGVPVKPNEIDFSRKLRHENIIKTYNVITPNICDIPTIMLLMEPGIQSLQNVITSEYRNAEYFKNAMSYSIDILSGLAYLHRNKIAHLNICPENIIIKMDERKIAAITDFSTAVNFDSIGDPVLKNQKYIPPDYAGNNPYELVKVDSWAFGLMTLELMTGNTFTEDVYRFIEENIYAYEHVQSEQFPYKYFLVNKDYREVPVSIIDNFDFNNKGNIIVSGMKEIDTDDYDLITETLKVCFAKSLEKRISLDNFLFLIHNIFRHFQYRESKHIKSLEKKIYDEVKDNLPDNWNPHVHNIEEITMDMLSENISNMRIESALKPSEVIYNIVNVFSNYVHKGIKDSDVNLSQDYVLFTIEQIKEILYTYIYTFDGVLNTYNLSNYLNSYHDIDKFGKIIFTPELYFSKLQSIVINAKLAEPISTVNLNEITDTYFYKMLIAPHMYFENIADFVSYVSKIEEISEHEYNY